MRLKKALFLTVGFLCTGLGFLGVLLPLLPTTPFLLAAAFCFARSSERFHQWLYSNKYLGEYLRNYESGTMTTGHKVKTLAIMWAGILLSAYLVNKPITWIILPLIATAVTIHISLLKPKGSRQHKS